MQEIEYFICVYHTVLFFCSKRSPLNSTYYLIMRIHNKRELKIIANHSADIDYNDFMKIYRKCTSESSYFLTINTTLPASNLLRFKKIF